MSRVTLIALVAIAGTFVARPLSAAPITIGFDALTGMDGSIFSGTTEDGFTVSPIVGLCGGLLCFSPWRVLDYGAPEPALTLFGRAEGTLEVSAGGTSFIPASVQVQCSTTAATGSCLLIFTGFLGGVEQFSYDSLTVANPMFAGFQPYINPYTSTPIDSFRIYLAFSSFGAVVLDNIVIDADDPVPAPVPEPATLALVGGGLAALVAKRRRTRSAVDERGWTQMRAARVRRVLQR